MKQQEEKKEVLVNDEECEKVVLGTIIGKEGILEEYRELLNEDCFYFNLHRGIWNAIVSVSDRGDSPNIISVAAELRKRGSEITPFELIEATKAFATDSLSQYVLHLVDLSTRRNLWHIGQRLIKAGVSEAEDLDEMRLYTKDSIESLFTAQDKNVFTLNDVFVDLYELINRNQGGVGLTGTPTGFHKLDERGGLQGGNLFIVAGETSMGKALSMDEPILTPTGWVRNKDLKVGDEVCSVDGEKSFVQGIYPQGVKDMYRITFADGRSAISSGDHLWEVGSTAFKCGNRVLTTIQIKEMQEQSVAFKNRLYVPLYCGKFGVHKAFVIDPYILGVLIGDGCMTKGVIIANDDEYVYDKVKRRSSVNVVLRKNTRSCRIISITNGKGKPNPYRDELTKLRLLGCKSNEKFIPEVYLNADYEQRLDLLNGLMDTDGEVDKNGCIRYSTTSQRLANDIVYLSRSLGYKCSVRSQRSKFKGHTCQDQYRITIAGENDHLVVTLPRRKERLKARKRVTNCIHSVEYIGREECQCIKVSHPRELFVMSDFVVTHNTSFAMAITSNALRAGSKIAFYSMEMTNVELSARMIAMKSGVAANEILYSSSLQGEQLLSIDRAVGVLANSNLFFDDRSTSNIDTILVSIRSMKIKHNIDGAIIDYLQILNVNMKNSNKEQAMGDVARRLKNLAKELNIWIIALSQLNRDSVNPVPNLNRLRDSGQIAEAADVVMFVYRPEYYGRKFPEPFSSSSVEGKAMIDVAKGRNIGTMKFLCKFHKPTTLFSDIEEAEIVDSEKQDLRDFDSPF